MRTVIIGLGNSTLTDDAVGVLAARGLADRLSGNDEFVDVMALEVGGLRLMETMIGYSRAIILDSLVTGDYPPGSIVELPEGDLLSTHNVTCVHDMSLPYALELGRAMGMDLPGEIRIFGVRADDVRTFGQFVSPQVAVAIPELINRILSIVVHGEDEVRQGSGP